MKKNWLIIFLCLFSFVLCLVYCKTKENVYVFSIDDQKTNEFFEINGSLVFNLKNNFVQLSLNKIVDKQNLEYIELYTIKDGKEKLLFKSSSLEGYYLEKNGIFHTKEILLGKSQEFFLKVSLRHEGVQKIKLNLIQLS